VTRNPQKEKILMKNSTILIAALFTLTAFTLSACSSGGGSVGTSGPLNLPPVGIAAEDGSVVHGRAIYTITSEQQTAMMKLFHRFFMPSAYAATGSVTVSYQDGDSTSFTINVSGMSASGFSGNTLNLGSVALATLSDNDLKVCGSNGNTKCTSSAIRVYTTGNTAGFVNITDGYGAPVYTGTLNPTSPVGLLSAGSVQVQTLSIPNSKHTIELSDFPSPSYAVTSDFSNAGAGAYTMSYVVEYVLFQ